MPMTRKTLRQCQTIHQTKEKRSSTSTQPKLKQTRKLITVAAKALEMDSEQNDKVDATGEDNQSVGKGEPGAEYADDEEQTAYDLKQDEAFHNKFSNPETFYDYLWNESGLSLEAIGIMVNQLAEIIDVDKFAGIEPDLMQCKISQDLHDSLLSERNTWEDHREYLLSLCMKIKAAEEKQNPGETQDTSDIRTILHLQQSEMDIQGDTEGTGRGDG